MPTHGPDLGALSMTQLAALTGCAKETVSRRLRDAGVQPVRTDGRTRFYHPPQALRVILRVGEGLDLDAERARLARAQAVEKERRNAEMLGHLLPRRDVVFHWSDMIVAAKTRLRGIPKRLLVGVPGFTKAMAKATQGVIDEVLNELARDDGIPKRRGRARGRR